MKKRILMCEPRYFGVEYVINPWMDGHVGRADAKIARNQWDALHKLVTSLADVNLVEPVEGLPDMCFAANGGLVLDDVFIPPVFRVPQRQPESEYFLRWAKNFGFDISHIPEQLAFEGEGDALFHPEQETPRLWAGYGVRSSLESHPALARAHNTEVISLRLVDERFYHLDTCFVPLPGNRVMYYPNAFDEWSLRAIDQIVPAANRLVVDEEDAMRFACNAIRIGQIITMNYASNSLRKSLEAWGYEVHTTTLDEFLMAGGAAKCLCLLLDQDVKSYPAEKAPPCPVRDTQLELQGHLLDQGLINRVLDKVTDAGGAIRVENFQIGNRHDQSSIARIRVSAPSSERLDLIVNDLMPLGVTQIRDTANAHLVRVEQDGVAPDDFYSTTIYPTDARINGHWIRASHQRMDAMLVASPLETEITSEHTPITSVTCALMRDLKQGDMVACGVNGVRVHTPQIRSSGGEFAFMSAGVSSERRVETAVDQLAWELKRIKSRKGKVVVVAGPVVIHTGGGPHLSRIIRDGYVQVLLTGNALPTHDIELNVFGTSLGVDIKRGAAVPRGHQHHLRAINRVRRAGSIAQAVEQGIITGGVMYECVKHNVQYILAGSIRDDGPLPDCLMNLLEAQRQYAQAIEGADMILMLSSMLHSIGTGNMTPAGPHIVCVDISPAVVTKLADRGSVESTGIVTDVGLFLNLLASKLCAK